MQVILLERVERLGGLGETVNVKNGFARNFLLPQGKALRATADNKARFERERESLEALNAKRRDAAQENADTIAGASFVIIRQAGESGQLYGSVVARDIVEAAAAEGHSLGRGQIELSEPIKTVGIIAVRVRLHAEVYAEVKVNIARTLDEAERQARGEDVVASQVDEDRAIADAQAVELFEAAAEADHEGTGPGAAPTEGEKSDEDVPTQEASEAGDERNEA